MNVCAIYSRKSNAEDDAKDPDTKSVVRQEERARAYAAAHGWRVDDRYIFQDDATSGIEFGKKRPGLQRLRACLLPKAPFQYLVVSEYSRLGRDMIRTMALLQDINDADVRIFSYLDDREIDVTSTAGKFEGVMKGFASEQERENGSKRTTDAMGRLASRGASTGSKLFGYVTAGGTRVPMPAEAEVVRRIFKRRSEGAGLFRIAGELARDGVPTPRPGTGRPRSGEPRSGEAIWWASQVGAILTNPTYHGVATWRRTRQLKRGGTTVTVKSSPDDIIRASVEALRIVPEKLWLAVQDVNEKATASTWRTARGTLLSRPTSSPHLLSAFLACGVCGSSMTVRKKGAGTAVPIYFCVRRHNLGKRGCTNARGLKVAFADKFVLDACEEALAGNIVLTALEDVLEERRRSAVDVAPLQREAAALQREVGRLVAAIAGGADYTEVRDLIRDKKARIEHVQGQIAGAAVVRDFDAAEFAERVAPLLRDWRTHLKRNPAVAGQVLRKILPKRITATPMPRGAWRLAGTADFSGVLKEMGLDAVRAAVEAVTKLSGTRCPSPCSDRSSATCTTPPRTGPRR